MHVLEVAGAVLCIAFTVVFFAVLFSLLLPQSRNECQHGAVPCELLAARVLSPPFPAGYFAAPPPAAMRFARSAWDAIERAIGNFRAERGGMLGGNRDDYIVRHFIFDRSANRNGVQYSPNCDFLNALLKNDWNPQRIFLLGFVHSHPRGLRQPSLGDVDYAERILKHVPDLPYLLLPIVMTKAETGSFEIAAYAAVRDRQKVRIVSLKVEIVEDDALPAEPQTSEGAIEEDHVVPRVDFRSNGESSLWETFKRVQYAYDLPRLAASRIVAVGTGGAAQFLEELARAGGAEFVLIDPDVAAETNIATQQVYRRDLGKTKVDCLAERIRDVNPHAHVTAIQKRLDDLDDRELERLTKQPLRTWKTNGNSTWGIPGVNVPVEVAIHPTQTIVCGFTDNFEAQARVNRLALHLGLPSLCAQVYQAGRGAEITFTFPGVTPACHRCALSSRYKAYLEENYHNDVTSDGTPIFATTRLNALKGFVVLALLHHGSAHPRWGGLLERMGNRNLVQIRMDPDLPIRTFEKVLAGADQERILFDDVVWLPQKPDCPANGFPTCPDCGGTGDLCNVIGTFSDTRAMRR